MPVCRDTVSEFYSPSWLGRQKFAAKIYTAYLYIFWDIFLIIHMCVYIYIYIYIYILLFIHMCIYIYIYIYTHTHTHIYFLSYICVFLYIYIYIYSTFWIEGLYYINWITMTRKSGKHFHATYRTLDSCFDLIRFHQQCIPWSPLLEIEPATTESRAETLPLGHQSTSHTSDAKLTSHGKCVTT